MNNYPAQPLPPNTGQAQPNRKKWVILGSVIGGLVIVMGGCVACGALIGLSTLRNSGVDPDSTDSPRSSSRERATTGSSGGLAGTSWKGTMNCDDGDSMPVNFRFADSGNPIYEYQSKSGAREVEMTSEGQLIRFVPPSGGVTSIEVNSISVSSDQMTHTVSISHESSSGGTLDQSRASVTTQGTLSGEEFEVETSIRSQSVVSQPGIVVPGDEKTVICRAKLRQE